jgi:fumarylacetoacetase
VLTDHFDATTDPTLLSWIDGPRGSDFPIQNLPYGAFRRSGDAMTRLGVAIGERVLDLSILARSGLLDEALPDAALVLSAPTLNAFLGRGRPAWRDLRRRISALLAAGNLELRDAGIAERALVPIGDVQLVLPLDVGDYVDFYSSREHASNLGKMLRPDGDPLLPNWRWLPVGYQSRSSSVVVSGTPIARPRGQTRDPGAQAPGFGPTRMLDFELEIAFITGEGPALGTPIALERASEHIFGVTLLNDWSARDVQAWEYQPLGPFLSKSFATSLAPWIVTLEALAPFRVAGPAQDQAPLPYLACEEAGNYDIGLSVELQTALMRGAGIFPQTISRTNFRGMYWSMAQQLAHLTSNGARIRPGDLCASGTISGSDPGSYGSLIELTWRGTRPLVLADGSTRTFLEDGDAIALRGSCDRRGAVHIGLGEVSGTIR